MQKIGEDLGMHANAVSQLLYRGRENLLNCIEGHQKVHNVEIFGEEG